MKKMLTTGTLASALLIAVSGQTADAAPITLRYEALVTNAFSIGDQSNIAAISAGIVAGTTTVSGTFSYDTEDPGTSVSPTFQMFRSDAISITVDLPSFTRSYVPPDTSIRLYNNDNTDSDLLRVRGTSPFVGTGLTEFLNLTLFDETQTAFSELSSLPSLLDLADFSATRIDFAIDDRENNRRLGLYGFDAQITSLTELTPVPLPAALPLFAGGLGLLALLGWRRKRAVV